MDVIFQTGMEFFLQLSPKGLMAILQYDRWVYLNDYFSFKTT